MQEHRLNQDAQKKSVTGDLGFEFEPLANGHDGDAMDRNWPAENDLVARPVLV